LKDFCKAYLPKHDEVVTLEDEDGEVYETKFLACKAGLSGGWKAYAVAHNLLVGDAVVFQLRGACKFKVRIFNSLDFLYRYYLLCIGMVTSEHED